MSDRDPVRAFCNAPPPWPKEASRLIGVAVGGVAYYALMRRLGAPRWAAVGFTDLAVRARLAQQGFVYEPRFHE